MKKQETTITETPFLTVQQVRLIDVFVVAPFCFYVASQKTLSNPTRLGLYILGISTLLYNGNNYLKNRKNA
jgi:hypothetical protein